MKGQRGRFLAMLGDKVLIIEDALSLSKAIKSELQESFQIQADVAASIEQAKELLQHNAQDYFIATVDLELPDCDTGDALKLVNEYNLNAIIFTGQQDASLKEEFSKHDLVDYVFKSGAYSIRYICWLIQRVLLNHDFTVLIVDDSRSALAVLNKLLSNQGFNVITATDAAQCMATMEQNPDMVILDQFLPDGLGHEVCRNIRTHYSDPTLQIIGVSSKGDQDTASFFLKNGGNDFLLRPFNPEEFVYRINHRADFVDQVRELKHISEEKNKFLGMAAHDLRNPLGVITFAISRLIKNGLSSDKYQTFTNMIQKSAASMQHLLDDLLDISAIEKGKLELHKLTLSLSDIAKERVALFKQKALDKQIEIVEDLPESAMVEVDPNRISQVIDNLLSNAIKYSPEQSTVKISVDKESESVRFNIIDQGAGIKEEDINKLFKAFNRLGHRTTGGESSHGLGLSICLRIVEAHQGKIAYKDAPESGSHFYFELPK